MMDEMGQHFRRHRLAWSGATAVLLALLLYGPTLRLPIIYDSILHIRIGKGLDFASVWLPTPAFGFYRPLTFFPILLIKAVFGYYPAWLFHGLNVAQHALNVGLLVWLAWRLWGNGRQALLAGLIFAAYPFSYQAVAVYGHNVHPTIANLMLLALHAYLSGLRTGQRRWWWGTAVFTTLALLTHESAILLGLLAFLLHWNEAGRLPGVNLRPPRLDWRMPWLWLLLLGIAYLALYQFLPIERAPQTGGGELDLFLSSLYLAQGLVFPVAWFAGFGVGDGRCYIWGGLLLVAGPILWLLRQPANRPGLALALGWWGLAAALVGLALPTGYLLHGPRLLYLSAVGAALLWALMLDRLWTVRGMGVFATAVAAFILLTSAQFVLARLQDYARLTAPVTQIAAEMAGKPATDGILIVNLPQWLDQPGSTYAVGPEFVAMLGDYLFVEELLGENLRVNHPVQAVVLPGLRQEVAYSYGLHRQTPLEAVQWQPRQGAQHVFVVDYLAEGPQARYTGAILAETAVSNPVATLGPYQLFQVECPPAAVTLTWQVQGLVAATMSLFVQGLDADGQLITQADGPPLRIPPDLLPAGPLVLQDVRRLPVDGDTAVSLLVGAYDYLTGERLPARDATGQALPDNALRLSFPACAFP